MDYSKAADEFLSKMHDFQKHDSSGQIGRFSKGEMLVLMYLSKSNTNILPSEISNMLGLSSARTASILNSLEKKKLIERKMDQIDRRKIIVKITDDGKTFVMEKEKKMRNFIEMLLKELGEEDTNHFLRIFDKMQDFFHNHAHNSNNPLF